MTRPFPVDAVPARPDAQGPRAAASPGAVLAPADTRLFSAALDRTTGAQSPAAAAASADVSMVSRGSKSGELSPEQQFESFMLRSFVESMLPSETSSFYGEGMAGNIWKSMLAERIGEEMAAAGGIGIAELVADRSAAKAASAAGEGLSKATAAASGAAAVGLKGL